MTRLPPRNEQYILARLKGVLGEPGGTTAKSMTNGASGGSLETSGLLGAIDLQAFLTLAENLARHLAGIHGAGVIVKDLNPATIRVEPETLAVEISAFHLATAFAEEPPVFNHMSRVQGTPAYMSPEQTGRMNRPIDDRTDLYSLGATLYALATGGPPFTGTDILSLTHAHLTLAPRPPRELAPWLPETVSTVILTLLAKEPDDRYQSAAGLAHDARALRQALGDGAALETVPLKTRDLPLSPAPSRRLHGREAERAALMAAFAAVAEGGSRGLFVAGYAGVGKTSLIHELYRPLTLRNGLFISGKFEQFQSDCPFLAPVQSLLQLCQYLLAEPEAMLALWRQRLSSGLGPDAGALFEVLPEMEAILGPQAVAELGPLETHIRLRTLLVSLIREAASADHPLVVFLDDLQWADQASLDFMAALLEDTTISGLLLIGAYRDNEVGPSHPLMRLLRQPAASGARPPVLALADLTIPDLTALLADMLRTPAALAQPLAAVLHAKTGGNPFFTVKFVNKLYREGVVWADPEHGRWVWDNDAILAHGASANVIDLLTAGLATLPATTTDMLVVVACVGHECTLGVLALATNTTPEDASRQLLPALERGVVITPNAPAFHQSAPDTKLQFCHDRMRQAVYELRDDAARKRLHLAIARRFVRCSSHAGRHICAAPHYAAAAPLIEEPAERAVARQLFQDAALHARQAGSFATAERFLRLSIAMLGDDLWDHGADAAFAIYSGLHMALYNQSRYAEADEAYAMLEQHAAAPVDLVDASCVQIASLASRNRYAEAVTLGAASLNQLGIAMPNDDPEGFHAEELALFYRLVDRGALEQLAARPRLSDPALLGAAKLMSRLEPSASFGGQTALARWLDLRTVRLCIEHGLCDTAMSSLCRMIYSTAPARGDYATGYRAARVALAMADAGHARTEAAHALRIYGAAVSHWFHPVSDNIGHARAAFDRLVRVGAMEVAGYTFGTSLVALLDSCHSLGEMDAEIDAALSFVRKTRNRETENFYLPIRQCVRALRGMTDTQGGFDDAEFSEPAYLATARGNAIVGAFFHVYRALAACLFNDHISLRHHAHAAQGFGTSMIGAYRSMLGNFLQSLALVEEIRQTPKTARSGLSARLAANQAWLAGRAADAPMNFAHLHDLVAAESADVLEDDWAAAAQLYEMAMRAAEAHQLPWHRALLTETAGRAHMRRGLDHTGRALLWQAHDLYCRWGATGKGAALRDEFPFIALAGEAGQNGDQTHTAGYLSLLRASQALALETSLPRLIARIVELVAQLTGATAVRLLLPDDAGRWHLEGLWRDGKITDLERLPLRQAEDKGLLPAAAVRLTLRTSKPLIADDAVIDIRFKDDPHFKDMQRCALLALPVFVQGRVSALLMLESTLYRSAFGPAHIETLSLLCSQLAISIANLRLRQSLESKVAERTRDLEAANQQLQQLSHIDALTGIANRRMFDTVWNAESRQAARDKRPLAVMLIDVDHFKAYNDAYGHQAGDSCLQTVAAALAGGLRRGADLVARYGGEEFAVVLPGLTVPDAIKIAQTLREAVMNCAIRHPSNSAAPIVTVSVGVAGWVPEAGLEPADLLADADAALYEAKHSGRNQCVALGWP